MLSNALVTGWCDTCFKETQKYYMTGQCMGKFRDNMAWVSECRICFHQVVATTRPASMREYF
eukprot:358462-Chlamydomonas_euryale.AAC.2